MVNLFVVVLSLSWTVILKEVTGRNQFRPWSIKRNLEGKFVKELKPISGNVKHGLAVNMNLTDFHFKFWNKYTS